MKTCWGAQRAMMTKETKMSQLSKLPANIFDDSSDFSQLNICSVWKTKLTFREHIKHLGNLWLSRMSHKYSLSMSICECLWGACRRLLPNQHKIIIKSDWHPSLPSPLYLCVVSNSTLFARAASSCFNPSLFTWIHYFSIFHMNRFFLSAPIWIRKLNSPPWRSLRHEHSELYFFWTGWRRFLISFCEKDIKNLIIYVLFVWMLFHINSSLSFAHKNRIIKLKFKAALKNSFIRNKSEENVAAELYQLRYWKFEGICSFHSTANWVGSLIAADDVHKH